jgi:hypothetical protein
MARPPRSAEPESPETTLLDYLKSVRPRANSLHFAHVRLSNLPEELRPDHRVRAVIALFDGLLGDEQSRLFALSGADLVVACPEAALDDIKTAMIKLRFMFDDQFGASGDGDLIRWYQGEQDLDGLQVQVQSLYFKRHQRQSAESAPASLALPSARRRAAQGQSLSPAMLAKLRKALGGTDLWHMIRRQPVCALVGNAQPQPLFHEIFISIAELGKAVLPDVEIGGDPWLFQMLTETLDGRVLAHLMRREDSTLDGDVSLNLTVKTLLSPAFLAFDEGIKAGQRDTIVFELQTIDIFADLAAFQSARDFAHERGYRICIDGVTLDTLPFIDRHRLGVDLIKLSWDKAQVAPLLATGGLQEHARRCGPARMILCRCDDAYAVSVGLDAGIFLFQGRYIDELLSPRQKRPGETFSARRESARRK